MKSGKIWGHSEELVKNPFCEVHAISINPWSKCSEHKHEHKYNLFYVTLGELIIRTWKNDYSLVDETLLQPGQCAVVKPGEYHQFETRDQSCEAVEVYYPEGISDDIIRRTAGSAGREMSLGKGLNKLLPVDDE